MMLVFARVKVIRVIQAETCLLLDLNNSDNDGLICLVQLDLLSIAFGNSVNTLTAHLGFYAALCW